MRWEESELRGCNTEDGEVILKYFPGWRSSPTFLQQHQKRSGNPAGGARGGLEAKRRRSFYFCEDCLISCNWGLFFEGGFTKYGGLLMMMAGCENHTWSMKVKVDSLCVDSFSLSKSIVLGILSFST